MSHTPQTAELEIQRLIGLVTTVRKEPGMSPEEKDTAIAKLQAEIDELHKITGPRHLTGKYGA